jgi:glucokinase
MIDGERVGFAVARKGLSLSLDKVWNGKTIDYPTFIDALQFYLRTHELQPRDYGFAVAVAGVPRGDIISLANCRWFVSVSGLRAFLRSEPLILNDFAATAWSLTALDRSKLMTIGTRPPRTITPGSTFLVVGTGCGLGVATLHITASGEVVVLESEGGHSSFAPQNAADDSIMPYLRRQFGGHVSYERILSEPGLQNVYRAFAAIEGKTVTAPPAAAILTAGRQRSDPIASETLKCFAGTLGSFIGSTTLTVGAWDGVFLTGSMLHELVTNLAHGEFRTALSAKGRLGKVLENVPVAFVNYSDSQLLGAAAALLTKHHELSPAEAPPPRLAIGG